VPFTGSVALKYISPPYMYMYAGLDEPAVLMIEVENADDDPSVATSQYKWTSLLNVPAMHATVELKAAT
jgi:hypothetical protein